ncbi:hypothetical protein LQZ18_18325 [Lachnospiraceae bacterium ZAX-1]
MESEIVVNDVEIEEIKEIDAEKKARKREKTIMEISKNIKPAVFDDMRFLEALDAIDSGADPLGLSRLFSKLLTKADKEKLYKAIETPEGTVPIEAATTALVEIMQRAQAGKK